MADAAFAHPDLFTGRLHPDGMLKFSHAGWVGFVQTRRSQESNLEESALWALVPGDTLRVLWVADSTYFIWDLKRSGEGFTGVRVDIRKRRGQPTVLPYGDTVYTTVDDTLRIIRARGVPIHTCHSSSRRGDEGPYFYP
jgi:hypothetical protein